jgi:hypothetical protein
MTTIAAAIRTLAASRSTAVREWAFGSWMICYRFGFVSWRRKWEQSYPPGWDAAVFLAELEAG